ncbi:MULTISPECIES: IS110 family transposase [unclassified Mesorhizobium]
MDIHRTFAEVVVWEDGQLRHHGRVDMTRSGLEGFGRSCDEWMRLSSKLRATPWQWCGFCRPIASGFLPAVWVPDERTERLRRFVTRRNQVVRHRTRVKNEVHGFLQAHLVPKCPHADLFNRRGRAWLERQVLPDDERAAIARHIREIDRLAEDLADLDREIAREAVDDVQVRRLQTITGVNAIVASGIIAAVGDIRRFREPQKLVSYFGLNPRVRQSGLGLAQYGRISKHGRSHARAMLVEAAWAAAKAPGPLRAFFLRIRNKRGHQVAAVALARKLAVLIWHLLTKEQDYFWARRRWWRQSRGSSLSRLARRASAVSVAAVRLTPTT